MLPDLQTFFNSATLPETIELKPGETIINVRQFVKTHFEVLKNYGDNPNYAPFLDRLLRLKEIANSL